VPSPEDAIFAHLQELDDDSPHVSPESMEIQKDPMSSTAKSLTPSFEEVMQLQLRIPDDVRSFHVFPESMEVQMDPCSTTAASLVPSIEEATEIQFRIPDDAISV
jgi:hypothetical protein